MGSGGLSSPKRLSCPSNQQIKSIRNNNNRIHREELFTLCIVLLPEDGVHVPLERRPLGVQEVELCLQRFRLGLDVGAEVIVTSLGEVTEPLKCTGKCVETTSPDCPAQRTHNRLRLLSDRSTDCWLTYASE
ncbi:hypothetical protein Baya_14630 [Bagarius yarrelli]|uniref:Uncharacterized protein n=1 Tax=Bagarius yarrelli TaxID=175774 RepID=A0A556V9M4_BAGYA|nr:hypothetical protein Baya_14630 [Bagarius yarrelli]